MVSHTVLLLTSFVRVMCDTLRPMPFLPSKCRLSLPIDCCFAYFFPHYPLKEVDVGLAADIGSLARLPKITGNESLVRELALTARDFLPEEALRAGFLSGVVQGGRAEVLGKPSSILSPVNRLNIVYPQPRLWPPPI